ESERATIPDARKATQSLGTLIDHLPSATVLLLCEPDQLQERAEEYAGQIPENDPFFIGWDKVQEQARRRGMSTLGVAEAEALPAEMDVADDPSEGAEAFNESPLTTSSRLGPLADNSFVSRHSSAWSFSCMFNFSSLDA